MKYFAGLFLCLLFSCTRSGSDFANVQELAFAAEPAARAYAILQTGEQPLWFQLTENGPVHLVSIEDAVFSAALIPWPLALHISFFHERAGEIIMAVNRYGFLKLVSYSAAVPEENLVEGLALYCFSGGIFWQQYTTGGFVFYEDKPAVLLYLDDRFLDSDSPSPSSRTWTFNMESNTPFPLEIPVLEFFPADEGWDADTLRLGPDGFWYYRVSNKKTSPPQAIMLRTADLSQAPQIISLDVFFNSAPHETEVFHPSLPPLPEGFYYTGIGRAKDNLFASWEEQIDFNIGAAGFVVIKLP